MPNHPTAEGVAVTWLKTLALPGVATSLPALTTWPVMSGTVRGFAIVDGVVGSRIFDNGLRAPVISVSTWAAVPGSDNPQWGAANELAERVWEKTYERFEPVRVQQSAGHAPAFVHSVYGVAESRRVFDPETGYAHFVSEVAIVWTRAEV